MVSLIFKLEFSSDPKVLQLMGQSLFQHVTLIVSSTLLSVLSLGNGHDWSLGGGKHGSLKIPDR